MKIRGVNFVKLLKKYNSGWVAISSDFKKVVLSGRSLKEVMAKAEKLGQKVYFFPAGESYSNFVGQEKR